MPALKFWNRLRLMNLRQVKLARAPRTGFTPGGPEGYMYWTGQHLLLNSLFYR